MLLGGSTKTIRYCGPLKIEVNTKCNYRNFINSMNVLICLLGCSGAAVCYHRLLKIEVNSIN